MDLIARGLMCDPTVLASPVSHFRNSGHPVAISTMSHNSPPHIYSTRGLNFSGWPGYKSETSPFPDDVLNQVCVAAALIHTGMELNQEQTDRYTELTRQRISRLGNGPKKSGPTVGGHNLGVIDHTKNSILVGDQRGTIPIPDTLLVRMASFTHRYWPKFTLANIYSRG